MKKMRASADDQVGSGLVTATQELRDLARKMLTIGVHSDHAIEAVIESPGKPALHRAAFAPPDRMAQRQRPFRHGQDTGAIARTIIDDDYVRYLRLTSADDRANAGLGIESGNHHDEPLDQRSYPGRLMPDQTAPAAIPDEDPSWGKRFGAFDRRVGRSPRLFSRKDREMDTGWQPMIDRCRRARRRRCVREPRPRRPVRRCRPRYHRG